MPPNPRKLPVDDPTAEAVFAAFKLDGFFPEFNSELCSKIFPRSGIVRYRAGEKIIEQGESGRDLFLVLAGEVVVEFRLANPAVEAVRLGPGAIVGEMALLADGVRTATVACSTPVSAFLLAFEDVGYILENNASLSAHLKALERARQKR